MERRVRDRVKKPSRLGIKIDKSVENALMNAMNVKIQDRTQTMEAFSDELMAAKVRERKGTREKQEGGIVPRWAAVLVGLWAITAGAVMVLIVTGVIEAGLLAQDRSRLEPGMVRVPNVVNKNADEAEALLNMESLGMSRDRMVYSDQIPQGVVLYQEQAPGSVLPVNTVIVVEISMGRENDD